MLSRIFWMSGIEYKTGNLAVLDYVCYSSREKIYFVVKRTIYNEIKSSKR